MEGGKTERYSFSKLSCFENCKFCFYNQYIEHHKGVGNAFSSYGILLHSIMERYANGELKFEELVDTYELEYPSAVVERFPRMPNPKIKLAELYYQQGHDYLTSLKPFKDMEILGAEMEFEMPIDDWIFNGVIDLVYRDKNGDIILRDYKSKSKFKSKAELHRYARQLYLYSQFIKLHFYSYPKLLEFVMFRLQDVETIDFKMSDYVEAMRWAKDVVKDIRDEWDYAPHLEEFYCCNLCNFREFCQFKSEEYDRRQRKA